TERDLDTALRNEHHFYQVAVEKAGQEETQYTRDGAFYLQPVGNGEEVVIVTRDGHPVLGTNGPIQFSADFDSLHVNETGDIIITRRGGGNELVGQFALVEIERSRTLEAAGDNFFRLPDLEELNLTVADLVRDVPATERLVESG